MQLTWSSAHQTCTQEMMPCEQVAQRAQQTEGRVEQCSNNAPRTFHGSLLLGSTGAESVCKGGVSRGHSQGQGCNSMQGHVHAQWT
jgi:hypothetical protein